VATAARSTAGALRTRGRTLLLALALLPWPAAFAHKPSDSYLTLRVEGATIEGQWDIALRDLDHALGLDDDQDGAITWGELRGHHDRIAVHALSHLALTQDGRPCSPRATGHLVDEHSDGNYAVLRFEARCERAPEVLGVAYRLFFDIDPQHRGLLRLEHGGQTRTAIFSAGQPTQDFELAEPSRLRQFGDYASHGTWHIWIGFDHILFLLSLLLPAVLVRRDGRWCAADRFGPALWNVFQVVTAFTLAHSITLSLAALGVVTLPSRWVESAIAASVVLAAINNLLPRVLERRWLIAFAFGLIHGFGFASVLADLGLPQGTLLLALVAFNLGVECGQLAIVAAFLPLAWSLRHTWAYRSGVLGFGSLTVASIAAVWLVERAFGLRLIG
jgi:hypothetical protein